MEPDNASSTENDHQRRVDALRQLASENAQDGQTGPGSDLPPAGSSAQTATPSLSRRRTWFTVIGALLAVVVVGVSLLAGLPQRLISGGTRTPAPPVAIPNELVLDLQQSSLDCPVQAAWSPDTLSIAVTLTKEGCDVSPGAPQPMQIAVFDARTGALKQTFDTQRVVPAGSASLPSGAILWSRDGREVLFDATTTDNQGELIPALAIFRLDGGKPRVLRSAPVAADNRVASVIWNMSAGGATTLPTPPVPALSYQWGANGAVTVADAAPSTTQTQGYSGSPVFTPESQTIPLWQPGVLVPLQGVDKTGTSTPFLAPPAYAFAASTYVWSPDGRYLTALLHLVGRLPALPGIQAERLVPGHCFSGMRDLRPACTNPAVPFADHALEAVVRAAEVPQVLTFPGQPTIEQYVRAAVPVAWRPDGKLLATILPTNGFGVLNSTPTTITVSLYDTATGKQIAALGIKHTPSSSGDTLPSDDVLAWSPTGKQLAFVDYNSNRVVIWGASQLPA